MSQNDSRSLPDHTVRQAPFAGSAAIVFGSGRNIGRAVVLEFARRGARVAVADLDLAGAEETAAMIRQGGGEAVALAVDVASEQSVRAAADAAERALGPIDIVMNNAGILSGGNPEDIPLSAWQQTMDVNFFGMVRSILVFLPRMLECGSGYIVNTASFAGMYPYASSRMHYAASKAAVLSLSENLAIYCLPRGIRVSCLCPGPVMTTLGLSERSFSTDSFMTAPGSHLVLKSQEETALILADGMRDGKIIIPTHEEIRATLAEYGPDPDAYIHKKIAEFAAGDSGRPQVPEHFLRGRRDA